MYVDHFYYHVNGSHPNVRFSYFRRKVRFFSCFHVKGSQVKNSSSNGIRDLTQDRRDGTTVNNYLQGHYGQVVHVLQVDRLYVCFVKSGRCVIFNAGLNRLSRYIFFPSSAT